MKINANCSGRRYQGGRQKINRSLSFINEDLFFPFQRREPRSEQFAKKVSYPSVKDNSLKFHQGSLRWLINKTHKTINQNPGWQLVAKHDHQPDCYQPSIKKCTNYDVRIEIFYHQPFFTTPEPVEGPPTFSLPTRTNSRTISLRWRFAGELVTKRNFMCTCACVCQFRNRYIIAVTDTYRFRFNSQKNNE